MRVNNNKYPYPYNLLEDMKKYCGNSTNGDKLSKINPKDFAENIDYILYTLPERLRSIIKLYYQDRKTQREIGEIIGVVSARAGELLLKSIRKLINIDKWKYIYINNNNEIPEDIYNKSQKYKFLRLPDNINLDLKIMNLDFPRLISRSLVVYGNIITVKDLLDRGDDILNIRNLGYKSYNEIVLKLKEYGFDTSMFTRFNQFYTYKK